MACDLLQRTRSPVMREGFERPHDMGAAVLEKISGTEDEACVWLSQAEAWAFVAVESPHQHQHRHRTDYRPPAATQRPSLSISSANPTTPASQSRPCRVYSPRLQASHHSSSRRCRPLQPSRPAPRAVFCLCCSTANAARPPADMAHSAMNFVTFNQDYTALGVGELLPVPSVRSA